MKVDLIFSNSATVAMSRFKSDVTSTPPASHHFMLINLPARPEFIDR